MVGKILGLLYKETNTLNQAAILLGGLAFLSQVLAFLRDRILAHIFGAGAELDIYYAAFRVPDLIFVTVASVVSLSVLVPFIVDKESQGRGALTEFINNTFSFFVCMMCVVSVVASFLMPEISAKIFKGFSAEALTEVTFISRILLLSPIALGFSNLFGSLTQAYNRFAVYALAPLLYNVGIITGILLFAESWGARGVATGVIFGACLHALIQVPFLKSQGLLPKFSIRINFSSIVSIARISLPRTLTLSMSQIAMMFLVSLASLMATGSISVLSFSMNLQSVPLSIIGVSYSLAAFPTLSRQFRENNIKAFILQMASTARLIIFWSLPLTALFIVLRAQVVRVLLGTGMFDWNATRLTAAAVALFALSSVFQSLTLLFMRGFYSAGFTKKPFYINLFSTSILGVCTYGLVKFFYASEAFRYFISALMKVEDLPSTAVLMLPLGFSIGTIINAVLLWVAFEKDFKGFSKTVLRTLFEGLITSSVMGVVAYVGLNILDNFININTLLGIFLQGLVAGIFSIMIGVLVLVWLKSRELRDVWEVLRSKFWKTKVIATDPEIV